MRALERHFTEQFQRHAVRPALGCLGDSFSYAELQARVAAIEHAAVRLHGEGDEACLVGYVELCEAGALSRVAIRRELQRSLPHYMVPGRIVLLECLPKTASGKIDRKRLLEVV